MIIFAAEILCLIGAVLILFILIAFNPINNHILASILVSVIALFFGAGALSIKDKIIRGGGLIQLKNKIIGIFILLTMYGFGTKYFIHNWTGKLDEHKMEKEQQTTKKIDNGNGMESIPNDSNENYGDNRNTNESIPDLAAKFVLIWVMFLAGFFLWIMIKGGENTESGLRWTTDNKT